MKNHTSGYMPHGSGMLKGGGSRIGHPRFRIIKGQQLRHMPNVHLSDRSAIKAKIPNFRPDLDYNQRELMLMAEKILLDDPKAASEPPVILFANQLADRSRREIYVISGTPDPAFNSGMYWRSHPNGRTINSEESRKAHGASYYR